MLNKDAQSKVAIMKKVLVSGVLEFVDEHFAIEQLQNG
ncbi:MAG: hypothetical protein ACJAXX_002866 [Roseivirga sp.]